MSQTRLASLVEASTNVAIGFAINMGANLLVLPAFGYPVTAADALGIGLAFTAISVLRSYMLRRAFNKRTAR